jgi:hypothetical protein
MPKHLSEEARYSHLSEVSADSVNVDLLGDLALPISPQRLSGSGEPFLKLFGGEAKSAIVVANAKVDVLSEDEDSVKLYVTHMYFKL